MPELLLIVKKSEQEKLDLLNKVQALERFIQSKGLAPSEAYQSSGFPTMQLSLPQNTPSSAKLGITRSMSLMEEAEPNLPKLPINLEQLSEQLEPDAKSDIALRLKEEELQEEKLKVVLQTEKVKLLRDEFSQLNAKYTNKCQENEQILSKIIQLMGERALLSKQSQEKLLLEGQRSPLSKAASENSPSRAFRLSPIKTSFENLDNSNPQIINLYSENTKLRHQNKELQQFIRQLLKGKRAILSSSQKLIEDIQSADRNMLFLRSNKENVPAGDDTAATQQQTDAQSETGSAGGKLVPGPVSVKVQEEIASAKSKLAEQFEQLSERLLAKMDQLCSQQIDIYCSEDKMPVLEVELARQSQTHLIKKYEILERNY